MKTTSSCPKRLPDEEYPGESNRESWLTNSEHNEVLKSTVHFRVFTPGVSAPASVFYAWLSHVAAEIVGCKIKLESRSLVIGYLEENKRR
jgi:hypothetical protein